MTNLELIDKLCGLTTDLIDIVLKQREMLLMLAEEPEALTDKIDRTLRDADVLEYVLRKAGREGSG